MNSYQTSLSEAYLSFSLGKELFAIPVTTVQELVELKQVNKIAGAPSYLKGTINLRGTIIPVVENRFIFGTQAVSNTKPACIMIVSVETSEGALTIGLLADAVHDMYQVSSDEIMPYYNEETMNYADFIQGLAANDGETIKLLDINQVLSDEQVDGLRNVAHQLVG